MTERATIMRAKLVAVGLALVAVLIGAEYVRAAVDQPETHESVAESASPAGLVAAELDPIFAYKLVERVRGPYERSHRLTAQARLL
jgi:hypothetical protein